MSHSAEKLRRGTLLCFRKFLVSKNVGDKRGGGYHDFPSKLFCLTVSKYFEDEPFCVSEKFCYRKKLGIRGGGYHDVPSNLFCLTVSKHFVEETFRNFRVSKNFMPKRWKSRFSIEKFLSRSTEKFRRGTLVCCVSEYFQERKSLWIRGEKREGVSRFSVVIIKNVGEGWDSNPYLPLQTLVVLPTVPWEPLELLTNVSEIIKIFGATETRTPTYRFRTQLSYPLCHGNHWKGISDKCQWNHKNIWHDRDSDLDLLLENHVVLTPLLSFFWTRRASSFWLKKEEKRPYWKD